MTAEDVLPLLLEKASTIKRYEYFPLESELKKQNDISKQQYQELDKIYNIEEKIW